jgi:hypothetical protein
MELPPLSTLRHLFDRLKANDVAWFQDQWKSGSFAWLKDRLPAGEYENVGNRINAGDLSPLKSVLSKLDLPGFDLFKGLGAVGAAGAAGVAGATGMAGKAGKAVLNNEENKKRKLGWIWIPILLALAGLLAWLLSTCGGSKDVVTTDTTIAAETTIAAAEETVVAETVVAETTIAAATETVAAAAGNLLETATANGNFTTLTAAVGASSLTETLNGEGPFTIFAPTDDAFKKLPAGLCWLPTSSQARLLRLKVRRWRSPPMAE